MTSAGIRSGVNWIREKLIPVTAANERAISVFASPGKSSIRTWPSARMPEQDELEGIALADDGSLDLGEDPLRLPVELVDCH